VPILKAAIAHRGFAIVDVISPCVTFNDHVGSTKSYLYTRKHEIKATETDFVPPAPEILATIGQNGAINVTMHDGSVVRFKGVPKDYNPADRGSVMSYLEEHHGKGEVVTGLLYVDETVPDLHELNETTPVPLSHMPYEKLCPGSSALDQLQEEYR
jgi:2-oxoglutarate ferredoxin oxidoreductase subunit beta